ncbi:ESX-1 secretion-associated protein EspG1 [Mycolicibacterium vanbaalenii]|uniref:ESX-1 secretion-associated protein EspG1 n=1 Tax=Mycolicibacterium vanbaalenii TaxID=110539 RepID=A0A5S9QYS3_MYCVN|nr:ESX secretion-associated protein EspG [Mycolicibacterium vanbaalenii]CAA0124373.1 ESX-1 secretion-associated protein EspG1 [Mycolicibacterium vanbaalenii]
MTAGAFFGDGEPTHYDDVVGVEVTIDGMLVIADRLHLVDFPLSLGIRPNIPYEDQRTIVWDQVTRDLTAQGILTAFGDPHPEVAAMVDALSRPDRTLDCRWWRRDVGGKMVRFVVCRKGERHVVAARDEDMLVLQRVAPQVGLSAMVNVVVGDATAAEVEPLTGIAAKLAEARTADQLGKYGLPLSSARIYADATANPDSWVEITANERHPGGTYSQAGVGAGVLDSAHGRIVSIPRRVNGELYGSFLPGTPENLQRALDGLMDFLPSGTWFDRHVTADAGEPDASFPD